jgi:hypothetical protein
MGKYPQPLSPAEPQAKIVYPCQRYELPPGCIIWWSGTIANIPTGWAFCNGTNGTPDLRDMFILGAGNSYAVDDTGGAITHTHADHNPHVVTGPDDHPAGNTTEYVGGPLISAGGTTVIQAHWAHKHAYAAIPHAGANLDTHSDHDTVVQLNPYYALALIMRV